MKYLIILMSCFMVIACETKYNTIDTGIANGKFEGNMYDYLKTNSYDWDSVRLMIERAGLVDLFQGRRSGYEDITFFGPTNHSIRRWLLSSPQSSMYKCIADIAPDVCEELVMRHVVAHRYYRDDIPRGSYESNTLNGGIHMNETSAHPFFVYSFQEPYNSFQNVGPVVLYIIAEAPSAGHKAVDVASTNIESDNGVVHSLHYNYTLGDI